jgi:hypothetical protein
MLTQRALRNVILYLIPVSRCIIQSNVIQYNLEPHSTVGKVIPAARATHTKRVNAKLMPIKEKLHDLKAAHSKK